MSNIARMIVGVVVMIGAFLIKQKAAAVTAGGEGGTVLLFGRELTPASVNLIVAAFAIAGVVILIMGVVGALKERSR